MSWVDRCSETAWKQWRNKRTPRLSIPFQTEKVEEDELHAFKDDPVEPVDEVVEHGTDLFIPEETVE